MLRSSLALATLALLGTAPAASAATTSPEQAQLEVEKLRQEVRKLELENDRAGSVREGVLAYAPFVTVLVAVAGVVVPVLREVQKNRQQREQELEQRRIETRRRFDEQFARAVGNLDAEQAALQVSAAVALESFLRPEYEDVHEHVCAVLYASLAVDHGAAVTPFLVRAFERAVRLQVDAAARGARAAELNLARCMVPRADLAGLDLTGADFAFADLSRADLTNCTLFRAKGYGTRLEEARLSRSDLREIRFHKARCDEAHFHGAKLHSAELRDAELQRAEFFQAELQGAHLDRAKLAGARFDQANLTETFFRGAELDDTARRTILNAARRSWRKAHFDPTERELLERMAEDRKSTGSTPAG